MAPHNILRDSTALQSVLTQKATVVARVGVVAKF
jgi:hypothetical protein